MGIKRFFNAVFRSWWIVILIPAISGAAAYCLSHRNDTVMYQAHSSLYILDRDRTGTKGGIFSSDDFRISQQLMSDFNDIMHSRTFLAAVRKALDNPDLPLYALDSMISVETRKDSSVLSLRATWTDPGVAAAAADAAGMELKKRVKQLTGGDYINILDQASAPGAPISQNHSKDVLTGLLLGLALALAYVYIKDFYDMRVRTVEDIEQLLEIKVLGMVPKHVIR